MVSERVSMVTSVRPRLYFPHGSATRAVVGESLRNPLNNLSDFLVSFDLHQRLRRPADTQSWRLFPRQRRIRFRRLRNDERIAGLRNCKTIQHGSAVAHGLGLDKILSQTKSILIQNRPK